MGFVQGIHRHQMVMFPELLDDYIADDDPVRFIDAFVDSLDLQALGFEHAEPEVTGRPPYNPGDLLKLYGYGYLNRIRSSPLFSAGNRDSDLWRHCVCKRAFDCATPSSFHRGFSHSLESRNPVLPGGTKWATRTRR